MRHRIRHGNQSVDVVNRPVGDFVENFFPDPTAVFISGKFVVSKSETDVGLYQKPRKAVGKHVERLLFPVSVVFLEECAVFVKQSGGEVIRIIHGLVNRTGHDERVNCVRRKLVETVKFHLREEFAIFALKRKNQLNYLKRGILPVDVSVADSLKDIFHDIEKCIGFGKNVDVFNNIITDCTGQNAVNKTLNHNQSRVKQRLVVEIIFHAVVDSDNAEQLADVDIYDTAVNHVFDKDAEIERDGFFTVDFFTVVYQRKRQHLQYF